MAARQIEEIILKISVDDKKAAGKIKGISKTFDRGQSSAAAFNKTLLKIGASLLTVAGGIRAVGKASDVALDFEKVGNVLNTVFGTSEKVAQEWEFISRISETLGLNNLKLAGSYAKIAAAAKGTSVEGQGARDILVGVASAASALSLDAEQTKGTMKALTDILSKGKVQAEELRGQLGDRIPGAFQIAARAMGVTTAALDKMLETGKLLSEDFIPKFAKQLKTEFAGGALAAANKSVASLNRISNELNDTWRKFGVVANSFLPFIANSVIPSVTQAMESLLDTSLDYAEKILPEILTVASGVFSGMGTLFNALGTVAGAIFSFIGDGWNLLFTEITGDQNWVEQITGFLTVAAQAWPQLIANTFLNIAKVISLALSKVEEQFNKVTNRLGNLILDFQTLLPEDFGGISVELAEEAKKVQLADSSFFKDLASEQQRLLDENNKTIQQFSDAAIEKQGEERANFKDLIGNLRENIKNVFDINNIRAKDINRRDGAPTISKGGKLAKPVSTTFEVGTAAGSAFLQQTKVGVEQLTELKQINKNTKVPQTMLIAK